MINKITAQIYYLFDSRICIFLIKHDCVWLKLSFFKHILQQLQYEPKGYAGGYGYNIVHYRCMHTIDAQYSTLWHMIYYEIVHYDTVYKKYDIPYECKLRQVCFNFNSWQDLFRFCNKYRHKFIQKNILWIWSWISQDKRRCARNEQHVSQS